MSPLLWPYKAVFLSTMPGSLHFLFQAAQTGSTVSNIEANAWSDFPVPQDKASSQCCLSQSTRSSSVGLAETQPSCGRAAASPLQTFHYTHKADIFWQDAVWLPGCSSIWFGAGRKPFPKQQCASIPKDTDNCRTNSSGTGWPKNVQMFKFQAINSTRWGQPPSEYLVLPPLLTLVYKSTEMWL